MARFFLFYTLIGLFVATVVTPVQATEVTLDDAVATALESSESMRIVEYQANEIRMNAKEATAFIKPQITLTASHTELDNNLPDIGAPYSFLYPDREVSAGIQGSQILYAGKRIWRSLDLEKSLNQSAILAETAGKRDIRRAVAQAFHGALFQKESMEILRNRRSQRLAELGDAKDLFEVGMVAQLDVRQAKMNLNLATDALKNSEAKYSDAIIQLNLAIGRSGRDDLLTPKGLLSEIPNLKRLLQAIEEKLAQDAFVDLQRLVNEYESAQLNYQITKGQYHPELSLVSSASTKGEEYDDRYEYFNIGLQLKWDFYTGGAIRAKTAVAKMQMKSLEERVNKLRKELSGEVERISKNLNVLLEREVTQKESIKLSQENYEDARAQYRAGTITLTRLGDFGLADAESKFALARIYYLQQELANDMKALVSE